MEFLKFNAGGQWTLEKKADRPADDDFMSYKNVDRAGELPKDYGRKGWLHNNSNTRPPRVKSKHRMEGKVPNPMSSATVANNPGKGVN